MATCHFPRLSEAVDGDMEIASGVISQRMYGPECWSIVLSCVNQMSFHIYPTPFQSLSRYEHSEASWYASKIFAHFSGLTFKFSNRYGQEI